MVTPRESHWLREGLYGVTALKFKVIFLVDTLVPSLYRLREQAVSIHHSNVLSVNAVELLYCLHP